MLDDDAVPGARLGTGRDGCTTFWKGESTGHTLLIAQTAADRVDAPKACVSVMGKRALFDVVNDLVLRD
jgi:hypothetical protein